MSACMRLLCDTTTTLRIGRVSALPMWMFGGRMRKHLERVTPEFSKMRRRRKELRELWVQGDPENVHPVQTRRRCGRGNGKPVCCTSWPMRRRRKRRRRRRTSTSLPWGIPVGRPMGSSLGLPMGRPIGIPMRRPKGSPMGRPMEIPMKIPM